jgi:CPA1 family monovalent cation:H+ antiporter
LSLQVSLPALIDASQAVLWAIVTVIVGRVLVMYGLNGLMQKITNPIPIHWLHVWNWSGMRGAIGMALVFSLPQEFTEFRELLNLMVFGVVLFSVLVQSSTLLSLLRWRGVEPLPPVL